MRIDKAIGIIGGIFILAGIGSMLFLPGEKKWNKDADIRVGSGADISGVIMEETLQEINEKYKVSTSTESSSFQDCCSNTSGFSFNGKNCFATADCMRLPLPAARIIAVHLGFSPFS